MENTRYYVGVNGIVICINKKCGTDVAGVFNHSYCKKEKQFHSFDELIYEMGRFYDRVGFPQPGNNERTFGKEVGHGIRRERLVKVMNDDELLKKHGDLGSFLVQVQHRQNSSWQGRVTWLEENKTIYFRSIWEMLKLMESAIDKVDPQAEEIEDWT